MVATVNLAHTSKINPPGATPVLTRAQVWAGLQRKIRFAQEFVPIIDGCEVLKDDSGVVERIVKFKKGMGPRDEAREVVRGWEDCWVCEARYCPMSVVSRLDLANCAARSILSKTTGPMFAMLFRTDRLGRTTTFI
jgi:hypothetical protein